MRLKGKREYRTRSMNKKQRVTRNAPLKWHLLERNLLEKILQNNPTCCVITDVQSQNFGEKKQAIRCPLSSTSGKGSLLFKDFALQRSPFDTPTNSEILNLGLICLAIYNDKHKQGSSFKLSLDSLSRALLWRSVLLNLAPLLFLASVRTAMPQSLTKMSSSSNYLLHSTRGLKRDYATAAITMEPPGRALLIHPPANGFSGLPRIPPNASHFNP
ncbi:hypothetical protein KQX54_006150 [Cotesia glomerata]|uniref:Uncharacterized protein n=1 Tax=Cotesia glomerata TaxID=32391 RepID=A0AAV7I9H0_COTGL|nr:hypothetical protein KQX54_006150 [Cotesia glomerata]